MRPTSKRKRAEEKETSGRKGKGRSLAASPTGRSSPRFARKRDWRPDPSSSSCDLPSEVIYLRFHRDFSVIWGCCFALFSPCFDRLFFPDFVSSVAGFLVAGRIARLCWRNFLVEVLRQVHPSLLPFGSFIIISFLFDL
ncbi:hypothetical protein KSP39_PZI012624 [Platanthera zijinensis]|uniref:Uncharacterized protein n=1 Tax=Platanthera zijinensis TaxID=2320716 RepID=A0AAP0G4G7_9ASPA